VPCGLIVVSTDPTGDPFPPAAVVGETREGDRWLPTVTVQGRPLPLPPFVDLDLADRPADDWGEDLLLVAYTMPGFFGTVLRFWTGIDGDHIVSGGLGVAPREPEVHLEITYPDYVAARAGLVSWRDALAASGGIRWHPSQRLGAARPLLGALRSHLPPNPPPRDRPTRCTAATWSPCASS